MQLYRAIPLLVWCLLIFWLSSRHDIAVSYSFAHEDKLFHAVAYAALGGFFWFWIRAFPTCQPNLAALSGLLFCSLYGVSDEWHQSFVAGRDASAGDWLADTIGAFLMLAMLSRRAVTGGEVRS